jgi:hypothetical protein
VKVITYFFAAALVLFAFSCSQFKKGSSSAGTDARTNAFPFWNRVDESKNVSLRRLESVTWDSVKHQFSWEVSKGEKKGDTYEPQANDRYEINMDKATMTVNGESRRFSEEEAANVRTLMDFISKYALESTVWWEYGEGEPLDGKGLPTKPENRGPKENRAKTVHIVNLRVAAEQ